MGREPTCVVVDKMLHSDWNFKLNEPKPLNTMTETIEDSSASSVGERFTEASAVTQRPVVYKVPGQYMFDELLLGAGIPPQRMNEIQEMDIHQRDVIVASYPKTGTTLLQEIVWLINNNGDVDLANQSFNYERILFIEFLPQHVLDEITEPRHFKTHVPHRFIPKIVHEQESKIVYIMRNPKDILVSYYHFYRMCIPLGNFKGTWDDFFQMFIHNDGKLYYGNMFDHMLAYWNRRNDKNLHIVFFEDLVRNPCEQITNIAQFLGKDLSQNMVQKIADATSFETMKDNPCTNWSSLTQEVDLSICPFMRKGVVGDWKRHFSETQRKVFDELSERRLKDSGLHFIYD